MKAAVLRVQDLTVRFGELVVLEDLSFEVHPGELLATVGPSGCGKSTVLNAVSGLLDSRASVSGEIRLAEGMRLGYAFQKDALLPWFTALQNVEIGAEMRGVPRREREKLARELLRMVHLEGFEHHYPSQLSGGMRHRAALARVLAYDPDLILLDEPFGALDAFTRMSLQEELLNIWRRTHKTMVLVTHDLAEALVLGTRVVVMSARPGRLHMVVDVNWPEQPSIERLRSSDAFLKKFRELWDVLMAVGATAKPEVA